MLDLSLSLVPVPVNGHCHSAQGVMRPDEIWIDLQCLLQFTPRLLDSLISRYPRIHCLIEVSAAESRPWQRIVGVHLYRAQVKPDGALHVGCVHSSFVEVPLEHQAVSLAIGLFADWRCFFSTHRDLKSLCHRRCDFVLHLEDVIQPAFVTLRP